MDLHMSQGDIDRTYRTEVTNIGKNRSVIVTFVQCNESNIHQQEKIERKGRANHRTFDNN